MPKNFSVSPDVASGIYEIRLEKTGAQSGRSPRWWIRPAEDKQTEVFGNIIDIISAANAQPDFEAAERTINERFRALCEELGCPLQPA
jgi:hypothetical protein